MVASSRSLTLDVSELEGSGMVFKQVVAAVVLVLIISGITPRPSAAVDGQMLCQGSDVFSNVFESAGRARTDTCPVRDCPNGTSDCHVEYAWFTKCEWVWCTTYDQRSAWTQADQAHQVSWCQHGKHAYQLQMRVVWTASATRTVDYWGENEFVLEFGGSGSYKKVVRGMAVIGFSGGYRLGVRMETDTGAQGSSAPRAVAHSASWITLSCP